jgi:hypothetical protein
MTKRKQIEVAQLRADQVTIKQKMKYERNFKKEVILKEQYIKAQVKINALIQGEA